MLSGKPNKADDFTAGKCGLRIVEKAVGRVLIECCKLKSLATITFPDSSSSCRVRFDTFTEEAITLDLLEKPQIELRPSSICFVTYSLGGRQHIFITLLKDPENLDLKEAKNIDLSVPPNLAMTQMRRWVRIPILDDSNLHVKLKIEGRRSIHPRLINMSTGGIRVEIDEKKDPHLADLCHMTVRLRHGSTSIECQAEVRQRQGSVYGLMFIPPKRAKAAERVSAIISEITNALERVWLERRAKAVDK